MDDFRQMVYLYDTEQKVENHYKTLERKFLEDTRMPPESPEVKKLNASVREHGRPLVAVGPFGVFAGNDGCQFSVRELQTQFPVVELESREQSKSLLFLSSLEKDWIVPRFHAQLIYSEDGIYKKGVFSVHGKDGIPERTYFDTKGMGLFDVMYVHENGSIYIYYLDGLTWELASEKPYSEAMKATASETRALRDLYPVDSDASNLNLVNEEPPPTSNDDQ
jgi:hypothetical protein